MKPIENHKDDPRYNHYIVYAAAKELEGGYIECHTLKDRKRLIIADFYRSKTLREYDGPVTALPVHLRERVSAQQEKVKAEKAKIESDKQERIRAYENRRDHP